MTTISFNEEGDLVIPRDELPLLIGALTGFDGYLEECIEEGKIAGTFLPPLRQMQRVANEVIGVVLA